jgi:hypothetical protein
MFWKKKRDAVAKGIEKTQNAVQSDLCEAEATDEIVNSETVLRRAWKDAFSKMKNDIIRFVDPEAMKTKRVSTLEAITRMAASLKIDDPTVCFLGPNDAHVCARCRKLAFFDGVNPRAWKVSELKRGRGQRRDPMPTAGGCHPGCRHALVTVLPGYGYKGGSMLWIGRGYDLWADQHQQG